MAQAQKMDQKEKGKTNRSHNLMDYFRSTPREDGENKRKKFQLSRDSISEDEMITPNFRDEMCKKMDCFVDDLKELFRDMKDDNSKKFAEMDKHLVDIQKSLETQDLENQELKKENANLRKHMAIMEGRMTRTEKVVEDLREDVLQASARSMRNNLIFYKIKETQGENLHDIIMSFCENEMKISQPSRDVIIHRIHRIGKSKPRPIIVQTNPKGVDIVMKAAKNLAGKPYGVNIQLPHELSNRKKQLMPLYKSAKQQKQKASWSVDKLFIEDKEHKIERDHLRDVTINPVVEATKVKISRAPPSIHEGSNFQGCRFPVKSQDDVIPGLYAVYADSRVARATHNVYAYRIQTSSGLIEHYEDDGEYGAGERILTKLREANSTNQVIVVTRWYGGRHLGPARFRCFEEAASSALRL